MRKPIPDRVPIHGDGTFKLLDIDCLHISWLRTLVSGFTHRWVYDSDVDISSPMRLNSIVGEVKGKQTHHFEMDKDIITLVKIWMCLNDIRTNQVGISNRAEVKAFMQITLMNVFNGWLVKHHTQLSHMLRNPEIERILTKRFGTRLWNLIQEMVDSHGDSIFSRDLATTTTRTTTIPEDTMGETSTSSTPTTSRGA